MMRRWPLALCAVSTSQSVRWCATDNSSQARRKSKKFVTAADLDKDDAANASHPEYFTEKKAAPKSVTKEVSRGKTLHSIRCSFMQQLTSPNKGRWVANFGAIFGAMPLVSLPIHMRGTVLQPLRDTTDGPTATPPVSPASKDGKEFKRTAASHDDASGLLKHAHTAVTVGRSGIHGRGLFALEAIPRGTRIITVPQMHFVDALTMMCVQGDSEAASELGSMWQYTPHQAGAFPFCITPHPGLLLNHSCTANVTCGLSRPFWSEAMLQGKTGDAANDRELELVARTHWDGYHDPNSFFTTKDIAPGEELTLDYSFRLVPMYHGELWSENFNPLACNCGSPECRGYVYHNAQHLRYEPSGTGSSVEAAQRLLMKGYDDETAIVSLLEDRSPLMDYLHSEKPGVGIGPNLPLEQRRYARRWVLASFMHTLSYLNSVPPLYAFHQEDGEEWFG